MVGIVNPAGRKAVPPLKVVGLFAGIGGLELGLARNGHTTLQLCENDPFAIAVLKERFPQVSLHGDVRTMDALPPETQLLCAGFPCQDLSSVGQKRGIRGARSALVDEVFRLLASRPVEWVLIENVRFMLHLGKGSAMRHVTSSLEALGYRWAYRTVTSEAFGLPQRRHRVFFLASRTHDPRDVLLADDAGSPPPFPTFPARATGFYWTEGTYATGLANNAIPPLKGGSSIGIPSPPAIVMPGGDVILPNLLDAERLQGFPEHWTKPAEKAGRASFRWRLLGNAVSVPAAEWIGASLVRPGRYDPSGDLEFSGTWPMAGWGVDGHVRASTVSDWPLRVRRRNLKQFLRHTGRPLSVRAASGFLKRADAGNLRYPPGFLRAIEGHLRTMERRARSASRTVTEWEARNGQG